MKISGFLICGFKIKVKITQRFPFFFSAEINRRKEESNCRVCQVDREMIRFVLHTRKEHLIALRYTGTNEHNNYTEHVQSKLRNNKKVNKARARNTAWKVL